MFEPMVSLRGTLTRTCPLNFRWKSCARDSSEVFWRAFRRALHVLIEVIDQLGGRLRVKVLEGRIVNLGGLHGNLDPFRNFGDDQEQVSIGIDLS